MTSKLLGLYAQTSIHAGTGQNQGVVDLPIMREEHNGWPCIFGSAMKGAIRAAYEKNNRNGSSRSVEDIFGKAATDESYAGALMVSDARLLLLPIRSLTTQFRWVTCPDALRRLKQDAERFGIKLDFDMPEITSSDNVLIHSAETSDINQSLYLEEYRLKIENTDFSKLIHILSSLSGRAESDLGAQLAVVSNDNFTFFAEHCTPVNAHIALDSATKTTLKGALWYEETLPPETLMYLGLYAQDARKKQDATLLASSVLESVLDGLKSASSDKLYLQAGGNETVGMGWFAVQELKQEV